MHLSILNLFGGGGFEGVGSQLFLQQIFLCYKKKSAIFYLVSQLTIFFILWGIWIYIEKK